MGDNDKAGAAAAEGKTERGKKMFPALARALFVVLVFTGLAYSGNMELPRVWHVISRPEMIIAPLALILVSNFFSSFRLKTLLSAKNVHVSQFTAFRWWLIGMFFNMALLGAISGDVAKAYYLLKGRPNKVELAAVLVFDRLVGLYMVIFLAGFLSAGALGGLWSIHGTQSAIVGRLMTFAVALWLAASAAGFALMSGRIRRSALVSRVMAFMPLRSTVDTLYSAAQAYRYQPWRVIAAMVITAVSQGAAYVGLWLLAGHLKMEGVGAVSFLVACSLSLLVNAVPVAPGGLGIGELGFGVIFLQFGMKGGVELAMLMHALIIIISAILGGIAFLACRNGPRYDGSAVKAEDG